MSKYFRALTVIPCLLTLTNLTALAAESAAPAVKPPPAPAVAPRKEPIFATTVFVNGRIPSAGKKATALAVAQDRILAIGTDKDIGKLAGPETMAVDLKGKTLIPGLTDAHVHLFSLGHEKGQLDLAAAADENDAALRVAKRVATTNKGEWIIGKAWDQNKWPGKKMPTAESLDKISPVHPVVLYRIDGHAAWVNHVALKMAGITSTTPDPEGGKILRDDKGLPTGVLIDRAMKPVYTLIPEASKAETAIAVRAAVEEAVSFGLTSVHAMSVGREELEALRELARTGELPLRVTTYLNGRAPALASEWLARGPLIGAYENHLSVRGFKLFMDGALGSRGAALLEPYADDPKNTGALTMSKEDVASFTRQALRAGFQVATHAIGDRGNRTALDAYEEALKSYPVFASPRLRIEHAQIIHPDDVPRFKKLGVVASMQPTHCTSDMPWVPDRLGPRRTESEAYLWR